MNQVIDEEGVVTETTTALATMDAEASVVALLNKSEIDQQVATAHRYPRNVRAFRNEVLTMATLNESVAEECTYALPRAGKTIVGPSARFAEIVLSSWGNCRAGARVVDDKGQFVVAQGAFMDLQKNVAITYEVQRRIVGADGRRFSSDMIVVTSNAACSIALRNAILKGVPKAFWSDLWDQSRQVAVGDATTLANRRAKALEKLGKMGATEEMILRKLGRPSVDDITVDDMTILLGCFTALKEGDTTVDELFAEATAAATTTGGADALKAKLAERKSKGTNGGTGDATPGPTKDSLIVSAQKASTRDELTLLAALARGLAEGERKEVGAAIDARIAAFDAAERTKK